VPRPRPEGWAPRRRRRRSPRTPCPHCGKLTGTVRGACTECWGSKGVGRRLFTLRKRGPEGDGIDDVMMAYWPWLLAVAGVAALSILLEWT
jgi:hypothetical protein